MCIWCVSIVYPYVSCTYFSMYLRNIMICIIHVSHAYHTQYDTTEIPYDTDMIHTDMVMIHTVGYGVFTVSYPLDTITIH